MTDISWPDGLPGPLAGTLKRNPMTGAVADRGEVGASRGRNRFTRDLLSVSFTIRCTPAQMAVFETFYTVTLGRGMLDFNWTDPQTGLSYVMNFLGQKPASSETGGRFSDYSIELQEK